MYDVIIIGAGPTGGAAAINSAKQNLKTLILEEHPKIGEPVHCGECLSELAVKRHNQNLPEEVIACKVKGIKVIFPNNEFVLVNEPGYVLEKHKWEQWIAKEAVKEGAELKLNSKVTEMQRSNGIWNLKTQNNENYQSKIVIDASGVATVSSRLTGLNEKRFESVVGMQYELLDIKNEGYLDFYLWPELAPQGYLWMIPKNNGRANVGLVTHEKGKAKVYLDEFLKRVGYADREKVKSFGGMIPVSGPLPNTFGEGIMLAGDAAGFTSPLFEGGSHLGLTSGKFAAEVAKEAVTQNNYSKEFLAKYKDLWSKEFPDYGKILKGKNALYAFNNEELNRIASYLPKNLSQVPLMDRIKVGVNITINDFALIPRGVISALKAFGYSRAKYYGW
ncbi:MAG TPA: NAD(P)/FAD-dependent oxidoreductase [archaeon]|nr:NAD(P)/FAD-dependent oxidoreductase [archaeon]